MTLDEIFLLVTLVLSGPYYILFQRGTQKPIWRIIRSHTDTDARNALQHWCRYEAREAAYVQVAGAVLFASVSGSLSWPALTSCHWTGPAFWYASIALAICSILTGAQQSLLLGSSEAVGELESSELEDMKASLSGRYRDPWRPSAFALFSWQVPVMLLCYSVLCFLAGLCSIVYSPLARRLRWDAHSKTALLFSIAAAGCLLSWSMASVIAFRLKILGQLMTDSRW